MMFNEIWSSLNFRSNSIQHFFCSQVWKHCWIHYAGTCNGVEHMDEQETHYLLILPTLNTPFCFLNFLYFDVYVLSTPIFPTNQRKCAISSRSLAILILLSTRLNTALNRLFDSQHCKRHRRKRMREFHLHKLIIHITLQPKTSF